MMLCMGTMLVGFREFMIYNHTVEPPTSSVDPCYALYADDDHGGSGNSGLRIAEELTIAVAPVDRSILIELNTNNAVVHPMLYTKVPAISTDHIPGCSHLEQILFL